MMLLKSTGVNVDKKSILPTLSLFTSLSTLLCCALPALLVTIGAGAALASIVHVTPWLVYLSKYKIYTFLFSGLMLIVAGFFIYRSRNDPCPIDQDQAMACMRMRKGQSLYLFSIDINISNRFFLCFYCSKNILLIKILNKNLIFGFFVILLYHLTSQIIFL